MKKELGIFILLLVLCAVGTILNPKFLSAVNITNMVNVTGMFGIFSLGLGLVIITGGIDLSVGSMLALIGVLLSIALQNWHWPWPAATLFVLLVAVLLGGIHGLLITRLKLQPFIVTLCGLLIYRGVARFIADDMTRGFGAAKGFEALRSLARGRLFGVPMPFVVLCVVSVVLWVVLHRSIYGRQLFAVGGNEEATRFSGIDTRRIIVSAYVIAAALTAISGVLIAFYTNSISPSTHGNFYELYGIAAAVLGGCSLRGGEGSVIGIVIGTVLLQVLQNLVNLLNIPSPLNFAFMGAVVLVGVVADRVIQSRAERRLRRVKSE